MGGGGLERVEHVLDAQLEVLRELVHGRGPPGLRRQPLVRLLDLERLLLGAARDVYRPSEIAEVPLQLAEDRWHGERRERRPTVDVEAVDGLHEPEARDLKQVVERLPGTRV